MPSGSDSTADRLSQEMGRIVLRRIEADQLQLPALPASAVKCVALLKSPDFSLKDAARIIERDPMLAAQLLKVGNAALMTTREPAKSVLQVVTRLGAQRLRSFLVEASARKLFDSRDARITEASRGLWEHSVTVAVLSRDVVALTNAGDAELGYLAGLLHDVGKPVVATMLLEAERAISTRPVPWIGSEDWIAVIQRTHRSVGVALATKWQLPELVCAAIKECDDYDSADRLSVANAVRFANALAKQQGIYVGTSNADDVNALIMIGASLLGIEQDKIDRITQDLKLRVKAEAT